MTCYLDQSTRLLLETAGGLIFDLPVARRLAGSQVGDFKTDSIRLGLDAMNSQMEGDYWWSGS